VSDCVPSANRSRPLARPQDWHYPGAASLIASVAKRTACRRFESGSGRRGHRQTRENEGKVSVTRGNGLLEGLLARLRAEQANRLIPQALRQGRILDIGCGSSPYFLAHTSFQEKFAIDQLPATAGLDEITWHTLDLNLNPQLPFGDAFFNVITMLAVAEHLDPGRLVELLRECRRVLAPEGMVLMTTPAAWSDRLLKTMARVRLVSKEEIDEHVYAYTLPLLGWYFGMAGFQMKRLRFGYFELGLNMWATARN
jgi:SAM-dependent methyltransferase